MNTKKQLTLAWTIVAVLAVLLAISGYFLANPQAGKQNISEKKDMIREHCSKTDQESKDACAKDLQDLSDILREFGTKFNTQASFKVGQ